MIFSKCAGPQSTINLCQSVIDPNSLAFAAADPKGEAVSPQICGDKRAGDRCVKPL